MRASTIFLAATAVTAATVPKRDTTTPSTSKAVQFKITVNPNPPVSGDIATVDGTYLSGLHVGAGQNVATFGGKDSSFLFYMNATTSGSGSSTLVTNWPPYTINYDDSHLTSISGSAPTSNIGLVQVDGAPVKLGPGSWAACKEPLEYYHGNVYTVLKHFDTWDEVPKDCASVDIIPYCATLPDSFAADNAQVSPSPVDITCYTESA